MEKIREWEANGSLSKALVESEAIEETDDFTEFQLELYNKVEVEKSCLFINFILCAKIFDCIVMYPE